ncbi:MAG: ABC transporter [Planctomycetota bacterium]|nr:MAG: ABC transporter [Planctomycetota bacterium]
MGWWHLTWKDLQLQMRDRRSLAVLLVLPLIFISIIGLSTGKMLGWRAANQVVQIAWLDRDGGELAKRLPSKLSEKGDVQIIPYADVESTRRDVFSGKVTMSLTIGPEFQKRIDELQLQDFFARKHGQGRLAEGLQSLDISVDTKPSWRWVSNLVANNLYATTLDEVFPVVTKRDDLGRTLLDTMETTANVKVHSPAATPASAPALQATVSDGRSARSSIYDRLVPGFTVMFTFFLVNVMARSFIAERDIGTLRRLRIAPLSPIGLLIGKTLPYLLISLLQSVALFVFGRLLFDMTWGEQPGLMLPLIACTSLAATSLGLLIAASVRTDAQVSSYSNLIVITLAGISGCFVPRDWMPDVMKEISLVTPHAWSLIGYLEVLSNPEPEVAVIAKSCLMLLGFSAVFFVIGYRRFRSMA